MSLGCGIERPLRTGYEDAACTFKEFELEYFIKAAAAGNQIRSSTRSALIPVEREFLVEG